MEEKKYFGKLTKKQLIVLVVILSVIILLVIGVILWRSFKGKETVDGIAFVSPVSDYNTVNVNYVGNTYSGVVEAQKANEVKADTQKTIKEVFVSEGDTVTEGQELFAYDVDAMKLELEEGQIEIERLENSISTNKTRIDELEKEKKKATSDAQVSYNVQIQSLVAENNKSDYDIKVKNNALEKLKISIENASVKAPASGTIKKLRTKEEMETDSTDVIMTIVAGNDFRIKGKINEQNVGLLSVGDNLLVHSRVNDTDTWKATIAEIGNEPVQNQNMGMYGGGESEGSSSNYAFYAQPESSEGLRMGQHVLLTVGWEENTSTKKKGIWLSGGLLVEEGEKYYVWASDKDELLEKRYVEVGEKDENTGETEILSGLSDSDLIAFPSDSYKVGMKTTTDRSEIPEETVEEMPEQAPE